MSLLPATLIVRPDCMPWFQASAVQEQFDGPPLSGQEAFEWLEMLHYGTLHDLVDEDGLDPTPFLSGYCVDCNAPTESPCGRCSAELDANVWLCRRCKGSHQHRTGGDTLYSTDMDTP